jgi:hypothetical protein
VYIKTREIISRQIRDLPSGGNASIYILIEKTDYSYTLNSRISMPNVGRACGGKTDVNNEKFRGIL